MGKTNGKSGNRGGGPAGRSGKKFNITLRFALAGAALLLAALGICMAWAARPRYEWYVEEGFESAWLRVLNTAGPPGSFKSAPVVLAAGEKPPENPGGFLITTRREETRAPVIVYPRLSFTLEYEGAHVLALDPWMIYRQHIFPSLSRRRIESAAGGEGILVLPGKDPAAVRAWTARMVQEAPGIFPRDQAVWDAATASLFTGSRFQRGSDTFTWQDVWYALFGDEPAWVYAPMSRIRDLPDYRTNILAAAPFPEPGNANVISFQARILWAIPAGDAKVRAKLRQPLEWLKSAGTQTVIADNLRWLPANPEGQPYDPAAMSARLAWLTASYVWEDGRPEVRERF
ncbi:MAG: hypothetical protein LBE14_00650 [Treponema sp.]|jgi:hypothetical protein|nr:hypothetical protein [Treponema sp.]